MDLKSLIPFRRGQGQQGRAVSQRNSNADPLAAFREQMNRTFDDFFNGVGFPFSLPAAAPMALVLTPQMDVSENDDELQITVDLPGLSAEDVEVALDGDMLAIRGEKALERETDERNYHVAERSEGVFVRSIRLPFEADPDEIRASFKDGVLTVSIPKPAEAKERMRRIEVQREAGDGRTSRIDRAAAGDKPSASAQSQS